MNLTPRQQEMVAHVANWLNRVIPESPLVVVPRWRLQEVKHEEVGDSGSLGRGLDWYKRLGKGLIVRLMLQLLPYRYRLLYAAYRRVSEWWWLRREVALLPFPPKR